MGQILSVADLLRSLRRGRRLTQQELAEKAGMTTQEISRFERGQRPISRNRAQRLARVFPDVTAAQLMGLEDIRPGA